MAENVNPRSVIDINHEIEWHEERLVELKKEKRAILSFNIFEVINKQDQVSKDESTERL